MKDFLDVLLEQMETPRSSRDEAAYLNRLKTLATTAPPLRSLPQRGPGVPLRALTLPTAPDSRFFDARPDVELFFYEIQNQAEPRWFRDAKALDPRVFARADALQSEAQVLETIAMGADLYTLLVKDHDPATLQYLAEVGADYKVPVILRCRDEDELARALFIEADAWIALEGAVAAFGLLELPLFRGRQVLMSMSEAGLIPHHLQAIILHFDQEEPDYD